MHHKHNPWSFSEVVWARWRWQRQALIATHALLARENGRLSSLSQGKFMVGACSTSDMEVHFDFLRSPPPFFPPVPALSRPCHFGVPRLVYLPNSVRSGGIQSRNNHSCLRRFRGVVLCHIPVLDSPKPSGRLFLRFLVVIKDEQLLPTTDSVAGTFEPNANKNPLANTSCIDNNGTVLADGLHECKM